MTRKLILHIGSHKTGTTSLQVALRQAQKEKALGNYSYLHARPRVDFNPLITCVGMGANMHPKIRWEFLERRIADADERGFGDCIISTEMLFWLANLKQIDALSSRLRQHFDHIRVVAYLRRQDTLALSHRKQVVLGRTAYQFYGAQERALPQWRPHMMRYFDYAKKLALWESAFGSENLTVRRYQKRDLVEGDTIKDFFALLDVPAPIPQKQQNTSMTQAQLLAGLALRRLGYPRGSIVHALSGLSSGEALVPARETVSVWLDRLAECNALLAAKYDPDGPAAFFDADLSAYPEHGNAVPLTQEARSHLIAVAEEHRLKHGLAFDPRHPADNA